MGEESATIGVPQEAYFVGFVELFLSAWSVEVVN